MRRPFFRAGPLSPVYNFWLKNLQKLHTASVSKDSRAIVALKKGQQLHKNPILCNPWTFLGPTIAHAELSPCINNSVVSEISKNTLLQIQIVQNHLLFISVRNSFVIGNPPEMLRTSLSFLFSRITDSASRLSRTALQDRAVLTSALL